MYVYTIKDFGSSGFTETTSITSHSTVIQYITIIVSKIVDHSVPKINLPPTPCSLDVLPKRGSRFYIVKVTGRQLRISCLKFSIIGFLDALIE